MERALTAAKNFEMNLSICCVNVRGIRQAEKRRDVFNFLRNKRCALYCLVDTHFTPDMVTMVRSEWGGEVFVSCGSNNSRGVAVLVSPGAPVVVNSADVDCHGNYIIIDVDFDGYFRCRCVTLYGPNDDHPTFFEDIFDKMFRNSYDYPVILVGDWNLVLDQEKDTKFYRSIGNPRARNVVLKAIENENLVDIWRKQHGNTKQFTWRRTNPVKFSRLDYFLISSELLDFISSSDITSGYRTDHSIITLSFKRLNVSKRKLFWKMNNSLLDDENFINVIKQEIRIMKELYALPIYSRDFIESARDIQFSVGDQLFFETLLSHLRGIIIQYGTRKKRALERQERNFIDRIQQLENLASPDDSVVDEIERVKNDLCLKRKEKMKGVLVRAKARWIEDGERPTRYFCSLEKRQYIRKYMGCLDVDGKSINDQDELMLYLKKYFEGIYSSRGRRKTLDDMKHLLGDQFPKLSEEEKIDLEGVLTLQEAGRAVSKLRNDKSPGPDGFSANFLKTFWNDLGYLLVRSLNAGFSMGQLSLTQRQGTIILVPKAGKPKEKIDSWRPISLLNTSQKVLSMAMADRLRKVMDKLISSSQKGFMKNRYIGECIRTVYDILWDVKYVNKDRKGLIIFADYKRAFDSLNHDFLFEVLGLFNFGPEFIRWVKVMLNGASSCIAQNKVSTEFFEVQRGCRQGDCCSPLLFILCVEVLSIALRANDSIAGYKMKQMEIKIEQFADDCTFILDGSEESFGSCMHVVSEFSEVSGLILNEAKTQLLWLGETPIPEYVSCSNFGIAEGNFKYLGIIFTKEMTDMNVLNFEIKAIDIRNLLKGWLRRKLTVYGKRTVLKALALSKLTNVLTMLPSPPIGYLSQLQNTFFRFVWGESPDKIKRSLMLQKFGIPYIKTYNESLKLSWVKRCICSNGA